MPLVFLARTTPSGINTGVISSLPSFSRKQFRLRAHGESAGVGEDELERLLDAVRDGQLTVDEAFDKVEGLR